MMSYTENTKSIRKLIIFHHSTGKSTQNIAKLIYPVLQYMIKLFKENQFENEVRKGDRQS